MAPPVSRSANKQSMTQPPTVTLPISKTISGSQSNGSQKTTQSGLVIRANPPSERFKILASSPHPRLCGPVVRQRIHMWAPKLGMKLPNLNKVKFLHSRQSESVEQPHEDHESDVSTERVQNYAETKEAS
uniref:Uncharacterized protein n=1 Tax=Panagrellus redivivus TaxID=6233 RepID=A0A7E4VZI1_PANRE